MNSRISFNDEETALIKQRYPIVDLENLDIPPVGLSTISSLDYLESAIKFDITNNLISSDQAETLLSILKKTDIYRSRQRAGLKQD